MSFFTNDERAKVWRAHYTNRNRDPFGRLVLVPFMAAASSDAETLRALFHARNDVLVRLVCGQPADRSPATPGSGEDQVLTPRQWMRLALAHAQDAVRTQRVGQLLVNVSETRWGRSALRRLFSVDNQEFVDLVEAFAVEVLEPERPNVVVPGIELADRMRLVGREYGARPERRGGV